MSIVLEQLTKRYDGYPVVNRFSLELANGELFVLTGPSGSGKSTVLRMIAGLNTVNEGRVILYGRDVTSLPPQERGVGFVFQHYALFPHMSVAENIEFALQVRKVPANQRRKRSDELLELVGLAGLGKRLPANLSGGQQQRVALARALAHQPDVLLLDEPFGALDAKIRIELRRTLRKIQKELRITTIFVTHDQEEAFEVADRLGVMNFGRLLEVGPPNVLYHHPQTEFVATFLGTTNLLVGELKESGIHVGPLTFPRQAETTRINQGVGLQRVQVLFRPEDVQLVFAHETLMDTPQLGIGEVLESTFSGSLERIRLRLPSIPGVRPISPPVAFGEDAILVEATRTQDISHRFPLIRGQQVKVGVRNIHALIHPGLNFLILTDGSESARAAVSFGGQIARLAHARVTVLSYGLTASAHQRNLQEVKEKLGSGLAHLEMRTTPDAPGVAVSKESEHQSYDLVIVGAAGMSPASRLALAENILKSGHHHLLLAPESPTEPVHALICVKGNEPDKEDVLFAGRFLRHLGVQVTLLSVIPTDDQKSEPLRHAERFLAEGVRSLGSLGVPAYTNILAGKARRKILEEMRRGLYDLLVLGAPLDPREGEVALDGTVGKLIKGSANYPMLIVRSPYTMNKTYPLTSGGRINIVEPLYT